MSIDSRLSRVFGDVEPTTFTNKAKLIQELQKLYGNGLAFPHILSGKCLMRPEIKIIGDCTLLIKHISDRGVVSSYMFVYEEVTYESLSFNKSS